MSNYEKIDAYVEKIIFFNADNNYYILATVYENDDLTITGNFSNIEENFEYQFEGSFVEHQKYGIQFNAINSQIVLPTSKDLIVSFLSGPNFVGIGEKMAEKIYDELCEEEHILDTIVEQPERLKNIKGLSQQKIDNIIRVIKEHTQENGLFEYLNDFQIDYNDVIGVFNKVRIDVDEFISIISKDPYLLMQKQISFKAIDKFAKLLKLDNFELLRAKGYTFGLLKNLCFKTGSTYLTIDDLIINLSNYPNINIDDSTIDIILDNLVNDGLIVIDGNKVYEYDQYENEVFIAEFVLEFGAKKDNDDLSEYIEDYEKYKGIVFNDEQKKAIDYGINCPISIITGGPGTGKSTIVDALINIINKLDNRLLIGLCAPTGKASKRLAELTGRNSMTIHKMLKFDMHNNTFGHNIFNPLDFDVLIIDEASMIDNLLMANLLKACFNVKKIIILGDYNQLPSVSQGQVLKDLIDSNSMYVTYLKQIYRQLEGSKVIEMAYNVLNKKELELDFFNEEVRLIDLSNNERINQVLKEYVEKDNKNEIQILAPIYKGRLGIDNVNKNIQRLIFGDTFNNYNISDRVIQLKNRNDDEIYNGDIGVIDEITSSGMIVDFDNKKILYNKLQALELYLAYCISIHKAQGNEYDEVILFLPNYNSGFMDNKILYTAITRTKKRLTIISDLESINLAIKNTHSSKRQTNLKEFILNRK
ncbi:exodeoxyribonuclease V alpha subunit [Bacilli bacterium PM5-9]|nr:exodeoxyribonuclease V alpha subunit [Bacilli bacterium PM5-9]